MSVRIYYPRAIVVLDCLFDDQVEGPGVPATFTATPRSVEVERNSARKADVARVELDYRDFPLDPRLLKDVLLTVHLESMPTAQTQIVPTALNRRFLGLVDEPDTSLGDDQTVKLEARDYTGIWLDFRWGQTPIPTPVGTTLNAVVESIRALVTPLTAPAVFNDPIAAFTDVSARTGRTVFAPASDEDSAWDVLSSICELFGLLPMWDLDVLTIRTAVATPTSGALMVYGQNVEKLRFRRALKQQKQKQVKVVAWNPLLGQILEAVYPTAATWARLNPQQGAKPESTPTVKQVQYNVEGPYTPATLAELAQRVYDELAQQQLMGDLETRDLTDLLGGDLLTLANGSELIVKLGPEDKASISSMSPAEAIAFLSDRTRPNHLSPVVAQALVDAWTLAQDLSVQFYVYDVLHRWDRDDGYRLTVRFRDFVLGA